MSNVKILAAVMALITGLVSLAPEADARRRGFGIGAGIVAAVVLGGIIAASASQRRAYAYHPRRSYYYGPRYYGPSYAYAGPAYYRPRVVYRTVRFYRPVRIYRPVRVYRPVYYAPRRAHWSRRWR